MIMITTIQRYIWMLKSSDVLGAACMFSQQPCKVEQVDQFGLGASCWSYSVASHALSESLMRLFILVSDL